MSDNFLEVGSQIAAVAAQETSSSAWPLIGVEGKKGGVVDRIKDAAIGSGIAAGIEHIIDKVIDIASGGNSKDKCK
jgi:hypothetical protein